MKLIRIGDVYINTEAIINVQIVAHDFACIMTSEVKANDENVTISAVQKVVGKEQVAALIQWLDGQTSFALDQGQLEPIEG